MPIIISVSIVSGFASAIESNASLDFNLFFTPEILLPLLGLGFMVVLTNFLKKKIFKEIKNYDI